MDFRAQIPPSHSSDLEPTTGIFQIIAIGFSKHLLKGLLLMLNLKIVHIVHKTCGQLGVEGIAQL